MDCALMCKGDDSFGFLDSKYLASVVSAYEDFGFIVKYVYGHPQYKHEFCANCFYPLGSGYSPGPTLRVLRGFFVSYADVPPQKCKEFLYGVALGLRKVCNKVPILHEFLEKLISLLPHKFTEATKMGLEERKRKLIKSEMKVGSVTPASYDYLSKQLNLPVGTLYKARDEYNQLLEEALTRDDPGCVVYNWWLDQLVQAIDTVWV